MSTLASFLSCNLKPFRGAAKNPRWRVRTSSLAANLNLVNYFSSYPLFSSKYLDYLVWEQAVLLVKRSEHLSPVGQAELRRLKSTMNDQRTSFSWTHLSCFYRLPTSG